MDEMQCNLCDRRRVCDLDYREIVKDMRLEYILTEYPSMMDSWKILQGIMYYREYRGIGGNIRIREDPNPCTACLLKMISLSKSVFDLTNSLEGSTMNQGGSKKSGDTSGTQSAAANISEPVKPQATNSNVQATNSNVSNSNLVKNSEQSITAKPVKLEKSARSPRGKQTSSASKAVSRTTALKASAAKSKKPVQQPKESPQMTAEGAPSISSRTRHSKMADEVTPEPVTPQRSRRSLPLQTPVTTPVNQVLVKTKGRGRLRNSLPIAQGNDMTEGHGLTLAEVDKLSSTRPKRNKGPGFQERYPDFIDYTPSIALSVNAKLKTPKEESSLNTSLPIGIPSTSAVKATTKKVTGKRKSVGELPTSQITDSKRRRVPSAKLLASMGTLETDGGWKTILDSNKQSGQDQVATRQLPIAKKSLPTVGDIKSDKENLRSVANEKVVKLLPGTPKNLKSVQTFDPKSYTTPKNQQGKQDFPDNTLSDVVILEDWQQQDFRAAQLHLLDTVLLEANWSIRSGKNMEREVFKNAKSKEDYTAGIQRLVSHFSNQGTVVHSPASSKSKASELALSKSTESKPAEPAQKPATPKPKKSSATNVSRVEMRRTIAIKGGLGLKIRKPKKLVKANTKSGQGLAAKSSTRKVGAPRVWGKDRKNCPVCGILQGGKELEGHLRSEHGGGRCPICRQLVSTNLQDHVKGCTATKGTTPAPVAKGIPETCMSPAVERVRDELNSSIDSNASVEVRAQRKFIVKKSSTGKKGKKYIDYIDVGTSGFDTSGTDTDDAKRPHSAMLSDDAGLRQSSKIAGRRQSAPVLNEVGRRQQSELAVVTTEENEKLKPMEKANNEESATNGVDGNKSKLQIVHHNFGKDFSPTSARVKKKKDTVKRRVVKAPVKRPQRKTRTIEERNPDFLIDRPVPVSLDRSLSAERSVPTGFAGSEKKTDDATEVDKGSDQESVSSKSSSVHLQIDEDEESEGESDDAALTRLAQEVKQKLNKMDSTASNQEILEIFNAKNPTKKSEADKWFDINQG